MATFSKIALSGSTDGIGILVAASATPGTTIHTGSTTATTFDEITAYAVNTSTTAVKLTIEYGGVTAPNNHIEQTIPAESGLYLVIPQLIVKGNATAVVVRAFAGTGSVIAIYGFVNRITA
jgi:hypothetical protein